MLSVLIHGADDPAALAQTLAPLVSGAVEGVLRDVTVLGARDEDVRRVADGAGCHLAEEADCLAHASRLRGEWVLILRGGSRLPADWIELVLHHVIGGRGRPPGAVRLPDPEAGAFRRLFGMGSGAVLLPRADLVAAGSRAGESMETLLRALRVSRMRRAR